MMVNTLLPRLGKKRPVHDTRSLALESYVQVMPPPPETFSLTDKVTIPWGMLANDHLGDCTCAAAAHMDMIWSAKAGQGVSFSDDQVIEFYNRVNGGADDGAVELFVLAEWRKNGGPAQRKIHAFVSVKPGDRATSKAAAWLFDGLYIGVALPVTAQHQAVWDVVGDPSAPVAQPGSWGGHAVNVVGYDPGSVYIITWGGVKEMTWAFWDRYVEEQWAVIPQEYEGNPAFDAAKLDQDIAAFGAVNPA